VGIRIAGRASSLRTGRIAMGAMAALGFADSVE
jgi:hypothetical protein